MSCSSLEQLSDLSNEKLISYHISKFLIQLRGLLIFLLIIKGS